MNYLHQGDNLTTLRNMPDESIDLICTDPPFNTGKDWGAFSDKWEGGLKGYLKFMEARVVEMRRVLKDTGSLYLHCDPTASHYLKVMLDSVFGIKQFRNEIVWRIGWVSGFKTKLNGWIRNHDLILYYTKTPAFCFNKEYIPYPKDYTRRGEKPNGKGFPVEDTWNSSKHDFLPSIQIQSWYKEKVGYPTQKPVALYERMIKASSNQHDVVLDPFAGSGTTLDAAHTLGRHWIGIDIGDAAIETIQDRLRTRHGLEYDRDYEIIRTL